MRLFLLVAAFALASGNRLATAQSAVQSANSVQNRIALSGRPDAAAAQPMRLACAPLVGRVYEANGRPLLGATLLVEGTHQVYVTDSEGKFQLTDPVYEGQVLTIDAAGYDSQKVPLANCTLPRLVLVKSPGSRIKQKGKRAGQVVRLSNRSTNMK